MRLPQASSLALINYALSLQGRDSKFDSKKNPFDRQLGGENSSPSEPSISRPADDQTVNDLSLDSLTMTEYDNMKPLTLKMREADYKMPSELSVTFANDLSLPILTEKNMDEKDLLLRLQKFSNKKLSDKSDFSLIVAENDKDEASFENSNPNQDENSVTKSILRNNVYTIYEKDPTFAVQSNDNNELSSVNVWTEQEEASDRLIDKSVIHVYFDKVQSKSMATNLKNEVNEKSSETSRELSIHQTPVLKGIIKKNSTLRDHLHNAKHITSKKKNRFAVSQEGPKNTRTSKKQSTENTNLSTFEGPKEIGMFVDALHENTKEKDKERPKKTQGKSRNGKKKCCKKKKKCKRSKRRHSSDRLHCGCKF